MAQSYFDIPVRFGYPNFIGVANPIYAAAVGMAMYELKQKKSSSIDFKNMHSEKEIEVTKEEEVEEESKIGIITKIKEFLADFF